MQRFHKTLGICILVTAAVYAVIKLLGGVGLDAKADGESKARSRDAMVQHERGDKSNDASTRKLRQRARKLTNAEATEFLHATIIPKIDFEDVTLKDALKIVNEEIAKQTPDDQPRPRILLAPNVDAVRRLDLGDGSMIEIKPTSLDELRLRNVPVFVLLKYICEKSQFICWFDKGDFCMRPMLNGGERDHFYQVEKLSRVKLEDIDASQLSRKLNKIIEHHAYFGPKSNISIHTSEKAGAAIKNGEVKLPRINLDLENITLQEVLVKITEQTGGALKSEHQHLIFNPFNEEVINADPFVEDANYRENQVTFDVLVDENLFQPKSD